MKKTKLIKQLNFFIRRKYFLPFGFTSYLFLKNYYSLPGISCPIRTITGVPCPTCFLTRSICASLGGDFFNAFKIHLFGPPLAILLIMWSILSLRRKKLLKINFKSKFFHIGFLLFLIYWFYRLIMYFFLGVKVFPDF